MNVLKRMNIRKVLILLILLIVAGAVVRHLFFSDAQKAVKQEEKAQTQEPAATQQEPPVAIKAFVVAQYDFKDYLNALGSVKGGLEFKLSFEIPGIIDTINYKEGEKYKNGALLMSLKQDDILLRLKRSEARLNKLKTTEDIYKQKVTEHEKLFKIGAIPESTLEKARLEYQGAQFEREEAELQVRSDEIILEKSNLYAPSEGMIGELNVENGEAITSNTLLGTHILTEYVRVEFGVIEQDVTRIMPKQKAYVYVDAYPDKTFDGEVSTISPIVTGTSRTAQADVKIDNKEGLLLPGMFARIKILLFEKNNALVIPTESVIDVEGKKAVFCVDETSNKVQMKEIVPIYVQSDYTVIADGLQKGEVIAISELEKLKPGSPVEVLEKQQM